ncbi:MAG: hydroxydechloroatrazine ethylaminohydrolase [Spirochaetes bacterium DG_61]|nr:MAG: hydroxydechloroatrazine ethylaminohydrolase [Spirochaetes bacterium DG_61]
MLGPDENTHFEDFDLLIRENRIERIAKDIAFSIRGKEELEVIDCTAMVVVPGFVNTHHHFYQTLTRNLPAVQNESLFKWLVYLYDVWKNIDEEAVFYSSLVAIGELLKTGCTCTTDHHYVFPLGVSGDLLGVQFKAAEHLGIRFSPSRGSMSLSVKDGGLPPDSVVQTEEEILSDSQRVIERYHDSSDFAMRKVVLAPCSPFSVTEDLMKESARLAREYGVRLHTHLAETADEDEYCMKHYHRRPLRLMEDLEFIGEDVSYAHGIFFTTNELDLLVKTDTSIAHCPSSNMRLGSGIARVREMLDRGINVALGVDGSASNDTSDFLGEMRAALLLQRVKYGAGALAAREVFRIATENGARLLNFKKIGKIQEGWAADLALFNINRLEYAGALSDPVAALLFAGINHQTEYTIVNGKIVVRNGRLTGYDEQSIIQNANRIARKLLK